MKKSVRGCNGKSEGNELVHARGERGDDTQQQTEYTYRVHDLEVVSDYELPFFDSPVSSVGTTPDIAIREGSIPSEEDRELIQDGYFSHYRHLDRRSVILDASDGIATELRRRRGQLTLTMTPAYWTFSRTSVGWSAFIRILKSIIEHELSRYGATTVFATACRSPSGSGVVIFGPSGTGKTTLTVQLVRDYNYEILSDDPVVFYDGQVFPFPRPVFLPRSSGLVALDRLGEIVSDDSTDAILSEEEVGIPRRAISSVPADINPDIICLLRPRKRLFHNRSGRVGLQQIRQPIIRENERYADDWLKHPFVSEYIREFDNRRRNGTREDTINTVLESADYYLSCHHSTVFDEIEAITEENTAIE